jgi:hypothetical protein
MKHEPKDIDDIFLGPSIHQLPQLQITPGSGEDCSAIAIDDADQDHRFSKRSAESFQVSKRELESSHASSQMVSASGFNVSQGQNVNGGTESYYKDGDNEKPPTHWIEKWALMVDEYVQTHQRMLNDLDSGKWLGGVLAVVMMYTLIIEAFTTTHRIYIVMDMGNCQAGLVEYGVVYFMQLAFIVVVCPFLLVLVHNLRDSYQLSSGILVTVFFGLPGCVAYLLEYLDVVEVYHPELWYVFQ